MSALVPITDSQLTTARRLAREGVREAVIRQTLGLSPGQWRALREAEQSPLAAALEVGLGEGAAEIIEFMHAKMRSGNMRAAEWLGERVYRLHPPRAPSTEGEAVPRVLINIGAPLTPDEYQRLVSVRRVDE